MKDSIFVSAIRCFCNALSALLGVFVAVIIVFIAMMFFSQPSILPEKSEIAIAPDANGNRDLLPETSPAVLRIDIHGVIGEGDLTAENMQNILLDSREDLLRNSRVKALLLHMDTPGGTVTDADGIYRLLMAYKKQYNVPIYAYVDGLCASGGMYICSAADKIYASSSSVIGSVGVILGPTFNFAQAMEKVGIQSLTISQGKDKDMLNPFRTWKPGEDESLCNITKSLYAQFVEIVTTARTKLDKEKLVNDYGAQVYVSTIAQEYGYIDVANSGYDVALKDLTTAANIADHPYQVVQLEAPKAFFTQLVQGKFSLLKGKITHSFQIGPHMNSELSGKFLYLYQPQTSY